MKINSKINYKNLSLLILGIVACLFLFFISASSNRDKNVGGQLSSSAGKTEGGESSDKIDQVTVQPVVGVEQEEVFRTVDNRSQDGLTIKEVVFGQSVAGRDIVGYEIGDGSDCLFLFGAIHGNEMGSADLLNKLVAAVEEDPTLVGSDMKLIILPIANPDGYYDRTDKLNANLINLNLNFATEEWSQYGPDQGQYAGSKPFSEPESQAIKAIVEHYQPRRMISYHSRGGFVNPEYNHAASLALASWYAQSSGYEYYDDSAYDYNGTATKWFMQETGGAAITVEMTDYTAADWLINRKTLFKLIS